MFSQRIQYGLDHFIREDYFLAMEHEYHLKEERESGKSQLIVQVENDNLCICHFDEKRKCNFLRDEKTYGMQKSVDHMIFSKEENEWKLHMIEMKSGVGGDTWKNIKQKVRTSYLTACAIGTFLGICFSDICAYTTYEKEKFNSMADTTDPKVYVPLLGERAIDFKKEEWDKGIIKIQTGDQLIFKHKEIKMKRSEDGTVLEGELEL